MQHIKHCWKADIHRSSWILRYDPERLHYLPCSKPLSGSRYPIIHACYRNSCNPFCFCTKRGCLWSSRHYLPQAKFAFTSRVQRVLFIYFIDAFVPLSKYSKSENYETCLVSQMSGYRQQSGWQAILWEKSLFRKSFPVANNVYNSKDLNKSSTSKIKEEA